MTVRRDGIVAALIGVVALGGVLSACSSSNSADKVTGSTVRPSTTTSPPATSTTSTTAAPVPPTWLCRPRMANDPCLSSLTTTVISPSGHGQVVTASPAVNPKIDCFYVYPTVSAQPTANANLTVDPQETAVAVDQASRFSQACNVYAPMYRQLTVAAIAGQAGVTPADRAIAYGDVLNAWNYYLAHDNHGRGVAFIGHSQGSAMLIALLKSEVDPVPAVRAHLVSAILLGGNVTVPVGQLVGGTFAHIPVCTNVNNPGCVIAYSSYSKTPPANSIFGRLSSPINALSGQTPSGQDQVVCVNPVAGTSFTPPSTTATTTAVPTSTIAATATSTTNAAPAGQVTGTLTPYFPTKAFPSASVPSMKMGKGIVALTTPWVTFSRQYRATCLSQGGATWLQIDNTLRKGDSRPVVQQTLGPAWGLHLLDVNIALGNLVTDLQHQAQHYGR